MKQRNQKRAKCRESNIELFRILTMLLIIAHHFVVNSGLIAEWEPMLIYPLAWRTIFLYVFGAWESTGLIALCLLLDIICVNQIQR